MTPRMWLEKFIDGQRLDTVLCIYGPQGSGKGILAKMIASWCEPEEAFYPQRTYFDGRFRGEEIEKSELVIIDEFIGRHASQVKEWAASPRIGVLKKGVSPYVVENTASFVIIRDQEWIEQGNRRIINCSAMEGFAILADIMSK